MGNSFNGKLAFLRRKASSFFFHVRYFRAKAYDNLSGVDFSSPMTREAAGIDKLDETQDYVSTGFAPELKDALKYLQIRRGDAVLDYGCGKGAALLTFSRYPFHKIAGIELSETLTKICILNLRKLKLEHIEVIQGDATQLSDLDDFNVFYFANPFVGNIFSSVLDNIISSANRNPRPVHIIYYNPKCHEMIMQTQRFKLLKQFNYGARRLFIYKTIS